MNDPLPLTANGVTKVYRGPLGRGNVTALAGFDVQIEPGHVVGLVGPNGSGKTTAIRCCLGLLATTRGEVRIHGAPVGRPAARRGVGYAPEHFDLAAARTGRETLLLLGRLAGIPAVGVGPRVDRVLEELDLSRAARQAIGGYSKGMVRRLSIAAALLADPTLLVLDEPFDGLDPFGNQIVREEILRRAANGSAVLLSSHALADLEAVATHLIILSRGKTLLSGAEGDVLTRRDRFEVVVDDLTTAARDELERWIASQGGTIVRARPGRESLEELFRRHVEGDGS